ncbi:ATP-dependent RNA helicase DDX51 [Halotydeus destructor]|nr:ATP-dependent RNA helicase DDX51 [Halotydeus destructor]
MMEFSSFSRYVPEEEEEEIKVDKAADEDVLNKLLRKAEKRKNKRLKTQHDESVAKITNGISELRNDESETVTEKEINVADAVMEVDEDDKTKDELSTEALEDNVEDGEPGFAPIGEVKPFKAKPVKVALPNWIKDPILFDMDMTAEEPLDDFTEYLSENIIRRLKSNNIKKLFPVQKAIIPYLCKQFKSSRSLRPRDVCVSSPTGSGKTLAFALPIINHLQRRVETAIRAIVILPVRDLAQQVFEVFETYCTGSSLKVGCAIGNNKFNEDIDSLIHKKFDGTYRSNVDILVCTPGRLVDLIQRAPGFDISQVTTLVLDEADRMMGAELEFNWMEEIEKAVFGDASKHADVTCVCNSDREAGRRIALDCRTGCSFSSYSQKTRPIQRILFSATLSNDPVKLQGVKLFEPKLFVASQLSSKATLGNKLPKELKEQMIVIAEDKKPLVLWHLIENLAYRKVLCFTGSVENTHRLYLVLSSIANVKIAEFSSNMSSTKRNELLKKFANDEMDVLICSDMMARGIDLANVSHVVCYDPPNNETAYVHRIGRTARAGKSGIAVTLLTPTQLTMFYRIIRKAHMSNGSDERSVEKLKIPKNHLLKLMPKYKEALNSLKRSVKTNHDHRKKTSKPDTK